MYVKWSEKMARSLRLYGNQNDCHEAIHEAFLKVMGYSDHLHLRIELTPKVEKCWFGFLLNQAKGILSHKHQRDKRFEVFREYELAEETLYEDDWGDVDDSGAFAIGPSIHGLDARWLKDEVRKTIKDICREAGIGDHKIKAFEMFVLDGQDGRMVVNAIPSVKNTNNLYQIKNRTMNLLMASADRLEGIFEEFKVA